MQDYETEFQGAKQPFHASKDIRPNPMIAAVLSMLSVGLGQWYSGRRRAAMLWIVSAFIASLLGGILVYPYSPFWSLIFLSAILICRFANAYEAWYWAKRLKANAPTGGKRLIGELIFVGMITWAAGEADAWIVRQIGSQAFRMPAGSMESTLLVGDYFMINCWPDSGPQAGDVVAFRFPLYSDQSYVRRIVAGPDQTVEIRARTVFVNGIEQIYPETVHFEDNAPLPVALEEKEIFSPDGKPWNRDNFGPITVPAGHYFAMGDNRDNSTDSRHWGFLPSESIIGRATWIYFSWSEDPNSIYESIRWQRVGKRIF